MLELLFTSNSDQNYWDIDYRDWNGGDNGTCGLGGPQGNSVDAGPNGKHIDYSIAKYNNQNNSPLCWTSTGRQGVLCQELGHAFGLTHSNNGCMGFGYPFNGVTNTDYRVRQHNIDDIYKKNGVKHCHLNCPSITEADSGDPPPSQPGDSPAPPVADPLP